MPTGLNFVMIIKWIFIIVVALFIVFYILPLLFTLGFAALIFGFFAWLFGIIISNTDVSHVIEQSTALLSLIS